MLAKLDDALFYLGYYWKSFAGFFGGAVVPVVAPLVVGEVPAAADYRMALGIGLSTAFFVAVAPKNRR